MKWYVIAGFLAGWIMLDSMFAGALFGALVYAGLKINEYRAARKKAEHEAAMAEADARIKAANADKQVD